MIDQTFSGPPTPHLSIRFVSRDVPFACGPRKCGQSSTTAACKLPVRRRRITALAKQWQRWPDFLIIVTILTFVAGMERATATRDKSGLYARALASGRPERDVRGRHIIFSVTAV